MGIKNLPKIQFIGAFFVILFLAAGVLFVKDFSSEKSPEKGGLAVATNDARAFASETEKDTDNDGLKDWEEDLWKTDKTNPDTDGDGTPDGEEVRNKRNPTKAGPDDEYKSVAESPLGDIAKEMEAEKNLTLTDIFARDFMSGYFALKDAGQYTDETRDKFIKTLFASVDTFPAEEKYTLADLTITEKSDVETLRKYGNALGEIALKYRHLAEGKELLIVENAISRESQEKLAELAPIIADYESFIEAYRTILVPLVVYEIHLDLLNINVATRSAIVKMSQIFDDPMSGSAGLNAYREIAENSAPLIRDLKKFFEQRGVIFNDDEIGYIFNK